MLLEKILGCHVFGALRYQFTFTSCYIKERRVRGHEKITKLLITKQYQKYKVTDKTFVIQQLALKAFGHQISGTDQQVM
ncbi:CLUMA_CG007397, isoform A [Clunio marinus]|uniref:CLUMA_CG007397, isoform A n=1 Tax=Clunio marinus TaxID=568069 RepID=A0A1J1I4Q1_9DIPT|nr:CLUMA_CG007397, isoform A [Clunio marinus]